MNMVDIISDKKYKKALSEEQISFFVKGVTDKTIPDYQISALLMAIVLNGMNDEEMTTLTLQMAHSGAMNDLSFIDGIPVDKHSSGGVGDKCTPIVLPLANTFGVDTVKLSGRGLGITGGTIDKFESIEGFSTAVEVKDFPTRIKTCGMVISGQTPDLAPADKVLYALRDVTATIDSVPLIASSIMSKKLAGGAKVILLDVKCGSGAFMKTKEEALELAKAMMRIGKLSGRNVRVLITDMNQPLGKKCGNILEMQEVYDTLNGKGPDDLVTLTSTITAHMVWMADKAEGRSFDELLSECERRLRDAEALENYRNLIKSQGGRLDNAGVPIYVDAPFEAFNFAAPYDGYVMSIDAEKIGKACVLLGAGRTKKGDKIDMGAGITIHKKTGEQVKRGDCVCSIYTGTKSELDDNLLSDAFEMAMDAFDFSEKECPKKNPLILDTLL